ncbi:MAG TPA: phytoene/squalene synthase family protein [Verrucomicrobiae bacterium]|jgi:farnesyl-diphosphate farnesyltransferase
METGASTASSLFPLLKEVSRSFYLTLRVLPRAVRPQIGLAYLLARATDTIADTKIVAPAQRLKALGALRDRILGSGTQALDFGELAAHQSLPSEARLLKRIEEALSALAGFSGPDQPLIRDVLATITSGQQLDLVRFGEAGAERIVALADDRELDDYTYRVAGCVGEFWTKLCRAHLFPDEAVSDSFLLTNGVRFGQGLQLVNILRDLPRDLRAGRCYLPADRLAALDLAPADLLLPGSARRLRPLSDAWLARAEAHLAAGWAYTNALPFRCARVRLACAWPILIGLKTLRQLREGNVLDAGHRIKVSRAQVRGVLARTILFYAWPAAWESLADELR